MFKVYGQPVQVSANDLLMETAFIEAAKQHFLRNTDKEVAIYQKMLKDHPENALADYYLASIYQDSALWEKAIFHGLSAVKKSQDNTRFRQKLASIYLQSEQCKSAIPLLQQCIAQDPNDIDNYQDLIRCFQKINDVNASLKVLDDLESVWGVLPSSLLQRHELYHKSGNIAKAKKELLNLTALFPANPDHFYFAAAYFVKNKDTEGAIKILKQLLSRYPDASQASFELNQLEHTATSPSLLSLMSFFSDNQIDTEKKRTRLLPEISQLAISKDTVLKTELLSLCRAMEVAHPSDALPLALQADIFGVMGLVDTALLTYKKSIEKEETLFFIWEKYLELLWKSGKSAWLTKEALFAWDIFPNNPLLPFYASYGLVFQAKVAEAMPLLEEALLQSTKNEELSLHINALKALAFSLQGDIETSKNMFSILKANEKYPFLAAINILSGLDNGQTQTDFLIRGNDMETALYLHAKALFAARDNQPERALKLFSEFEKWGTPLYFEHWGDTFLSVKNSSAAEKAYRKAAALGNTGKNLSIKLSKF
jgi:tetratricopeptide (TPR) repeat protein